MQMNKSKIMALKQNSMQIVYSQILAYIIYMQALLQLLCSKVHIGGRVHLRNLIHVSAEEQILSKLRQCHLNPLHHQLLCNEATYDP